MTISLVFDTETTGAVSKADPRDPATAHIVQLYAALYEHDPEVSYIEERTLPLPHFDMESDPLIEQRNIARPFAMLSTIIDAGVDVPKGAFDVHGIDRAKATRLGVDPKNAAHILDDFLDIAEVIVAHNIRFDTGIAGRLLHTSGIDASILASKKQFCTMRALKPIMRMTPKVYGDWKMPKLIEAYNYVFNRDFEGQAHDAAADSNAAADLYFACLHMGIEDPGVK